MSYTGGFIPRGGIFPPLSPLLQRTQTAHGHRAPSFARQHPYSFPGVSEAIQNFSLCMPFVSSFICHDLLGLPDRQFGRRKSSRDRSGERRPIHRHLRVVVDQHSVMCCRPRELPRRVRMPWLGSHVRKTHPGLSLSPTFPSHLVLRPWKHRMIGSKRFFANGQGAPEIGSASENLRSPNS